MTPRADSPPGQLKTRRVGADRVEMRGNALTVITPVRHIAGWDVRKYRAPVVRFDGRTWRITRKTVGADKLTCYQLESWELASTRWSVFIEYLVALGALALGAIAQMVTGLGYSSGIPRLLVLAIGVIAAFDAGVRWGRLFVEERPAPGFYEWLLRRRL